MANMHSGVVWSRRGCPGKVDCCVFILMAGVSDTNYIAKVRQFGRWTLFQQRACAVRQIEHGRRITSSDANACRQRCLCCWRGNDTQASVASCASPPQSHSTSSEANACRQRCLSHWRGNDTWASVASCASFPQSHLQRMVNRLLVGEFLLHANTVGPMRWCCHART